MITLVPSPLPNTFKDLERVADSVFGLVSRVQIDISDGVYTKTKTWPYKGDSGEFEKLKGEDQGLPRWQELEYELDMMVQNPEEVYEEWISAGMSALIFHLESVPETSLLQELLRNTKGRGVEAGVALRLPFVPRAPDLAFLRTAEEAGDAAVAEEGRAAVFLQGPVEFPRVVEPFFKTCGEVEPCSREGIDEAGGDLRGSFRLVPIDDEDATTEVEQVPG